MSSDSSLRIGFVSTMSGVAWGGSEQLWSDAAQHLREHGHAVLASVYRWPVRPERLNDLARHGAAITFRPRRPVLIDRINRRLTPRKPIRRLDLTHRRWLMRSGVDLLVISQGGPWDGVPWMLAARELAIPYCTIIQANSEQWWPLDEHLSDIRFALEGARKIFFVCDANRRLMERQCGFALPNSDVIANPCKIDREAPAVAWPDDSNALRLACVGRMSPNAKGQDVLLEVLSQPKWRARSLKLHLYGSGPSERSIKALAAHLSLANVFFHGQVADIRRIWTENHALVLPSRFEGLPLTIVEAMLCGRPVITTDVAGNTEVVADNVNGFVAGAATVPLLDEAMERAWMRRSEWREIGRRARESALTALPIDPVGHFVRQLLLIGGANDNPPLQTNSASHALPESLATGASLAAPPSNASAS